MRAAVSATPTQLPLVPATLLKAHHCLERHDNRFKACARLLQARWREERGLPIGSFSGRQGRKRRIGSLLSTAAAAEGRNFLSPAVAYLARRALTYQEPGALIDQGRLFGNMLSSMPMAFNVFGPLALDHALATRLVHRLFPELDCQAVREVRFEHSPGRFQADLTGDRSAFDVVIGYETQTAAQGFICFEVKYSESLQDSPPAELSPAYDGLAEASGLFKEPASALLRVNPLQQLFREHLLAQAAVMRGDWAEATFVLLAPEANHLVQRGAGLYAAHLAPFLPGHVPFANITLEHFLSALGQVGAAATADEIFDRYCAFWKVHDAVEAALAAQQGQWVHAALQPNKPVALIAKAA